MPHRALRRPDGTRLPGTLPRRRPIPLRACGRALALGLALGALAPLATPAHAQGGDELLSVGQGDALQRVNLGVNKSLVIDLPRDAFDILVANPAIADAVTRSARRIYLFGRQVGETNIFVFGENGEPIANIDLQVERDVSSLEGDLERFIPGSDIEVEIVNDNVVLSGAVLTPQDANRATQLAEAFLSSDVNQGDNGEDSGIINLLTIAGEDQVTLKLTVAEVQRSIVKQLGITLSGGVQTARLGDGRGLGNLSATAGGAFNTAAGQFGVGGDVSVGDFNARLDATLTALRQTGSIRTLAEPVLTAVSGESAEFRVGGAIAVRVREEDDDDGDVSFRIDTIDFGVEMEFKPVVLSSGRISINLGTVVSEPVPGGTDGINSLFTLRERVARTTVEVPSGGSFMIAGLINDSVRQSVIETPGLSQLPIIGSLFRSRDFKRDETEMVVIATPYLVRPVPPSALQRPDDNFHPANDTKGFLLGRINRIYGNRKAPDAPFHGNVGFVYK